MARILSALVLIPVAILTVIYAPPALFLIGIGLIGTACLYEYFGLMRAMGIRVQPMFGQITFWVLLIALRQGRFPTITILGLVLIAAFLSALWRKHTVRERALSLMAEVLGIFYFILFLYPAIPTRYDFGNGIGAQWILLLLLIIWTGDTFALLAGRTFGKHLLAPGLSPKKTYEGAIAGLLGGIVIAVAAQRLFLQDLPMLHVIVLSFLLGIFGQLGDFAESLLKRAAEIKDSSHLIPGHGGALDRMDSLLFAIPVLYFYILQLY